VNNDSMIQRAMNLVIDHENVERRNRVYFHMFYKSVFCEALNTKRGSCKQAGGRIVVKSIKSMDDPNDSYTIEELCKLRRSVTLRDSEAFVWFFATFLGLYLWQGEIG
jgi:hypothetical protein